ncbi:hypothetical protein HHK36_028222 [Tetracentron sinense]|uniref:Protein kinase domain-containing protein n=1 Tax=Tetracentron sinense TaxID=13715 RepID=A0A834YIU1_TETSI|nr:hypothetical protein HHK36_028222 [Tetracentron sinense]
MLITAPTCFFIAANLRKSQINYYKSSRSRVFSSSYLFYYKSVYFKGLNLNLQHRNRAFPLCKATLITDSDDFEVGRLIGSYGFMNITSYSSFQSGLDMEYSTEDMGRLKVQDVGEGPVKIRLYEGRVAKGPLQGTQIIFKVYPGQRAGGIEADMMAANEINAQAFLQNAWVKGASLSTSSSHSLQRDSQDMCQNLQILIGGFETKTGEQWLAFRNAGKYSAADYAKFTSESMSKYRALGEQKIWNPFDQVQRIKRRRFFVIKLLRGAMSGLAYMHDRERLHQSLGPASVVLNTIGERESAYLVPRLRDLAFSVDIRYSFLEEGPGTLSEGLWRRASAAGAFTPMEKRAFGIADDIYEAGLLFAYLAFVPFCEAGIMDGLSLQRLLESTFQLDLGAAREQRYSTDSQTSIEISQASDDYETLSEDGRRAVMTPNMIAVRERSALSSISQRGGRGGGFGDSSAHTAHSSATFEAPRDDVESLCRELEAEKKVDVVELSPQVPLHVINIHDTPADIHDSTIVNARSKKVHSPYAFLTIQKKAIDWTFVIIQLVYVSDLLGGTPELVDLVPLLVHGLYCLADDRLLEAVNFLDLGDGAGWELLQVKF